MARNTLIVVACVAAIGISARRVHTAYQQSGAEESNSGAALPKPSAQDFAPMQVVSPFPAITNAPMIPASDVARQVTDDELVLGVVLNGQPRSYPINMLTGPSREIVNDAIGDFQFAATW